MAQKYTLSHKNFAKIHCFKRTLKGILPHDTLFHNFLINCNTLSHNFYQKSTPCRIILTVKGHPVERHIPASQVWEYPPWTLKPVEQSFTLCMRSLFREFMIVQRKRKDISVKICLLVFVYFIQMPSTRYCKMTKTLLPKVCKRFPFLFF